MALGLGSGCKWVFMVVLVLCFFTVFSKKKPKLEIITEVSVLFLVNLIGCMLFIIQPRLNQMIVRKVQLLVIH